MPKLSPSGRAACGVTNYPISIEGVVPSALEPYVGGVGGWLDNSTLVFSGRPVDADPERLESWRIYRYHTASHAVTEAYDAGASVLVAGGGVWAKYDTRYGYRDSTGRTEDPDGRCPMAVDDLTGRVLCTTRYHDGGVGVWEGSTYRVIFSEGWFLEASFRDGRIVGRLDATRLWVDGVVVPTFPSQGAKASGQFFVGWVPSLNGLYLLDLHDPTRGVWLSDDERDFNPDIVTLPDGTVRVVTASGAAELPSELREYRVVPSAASWTRLVVPSVPPAPAPTPAPPPPQTDLPAPETPTPAPEPAPEARTEWVRMGNQMVLMTPSQAQQIRALQALMAAKQWERPTVTAPVQTEVAWPQTGLSYYAGLGDPDFDWAVFLDFCRETGVGYHRTWLIDAWATKDIGGRYDGFLPCRRRSDGRFDLFDWDGAYFSRLRTATEASNARGIFPLWTILELYAWSDRKASMPFVPDVTKNLFRYNVNGVQWGAPDDRTFGADGYEGQGLPDDWLRAFLTRVLESLSGTAYALQIGNEMPEKAMHWRIGTVLRALGYTGEIVINRNEDGPGQPFNMQMIGAGGSRYDRHEFHVGTSDERVTAQFLDIEHPEEAGAGRPLTLRALLEQVDPGRIMVSSDGDGGRVVAAQEALGREVRALGASFERQSILKRNRFFGDGSLVMAHLEAERPLLAALRR